MDTDKSDVFIHLYDKLDRNHQEDTLYENCIYLISTQTMEDPLKNKIKWNRSIRVTILLEWLFPITSGQLSSSFVYVIHS